MENLLKSKRSFPFRAANLVPRPRLFRLLDQGVQPGRRLTLISAPAGYGKTTLLVEWLQERKIPAAWLSLDEGDNDPARWVAYLADALQQLNPQAGSSEPSSILPGNPLERLLVPQVNGLIHVPGPAILVLDDYHHIHTQAVHDCLAYLIENLPQQVHIYLATRADPPLPLARLRGRGQLTELRLSDLQFTEEEAVYYLNCVMELSLAMEDVTALESRTEGWVSGLKMAGLALQAQAFAPGGKPNTEYIRSFTGGSRYILDYFVEEVLQRQPEAVQSFLLKTSILERMCGPLCDAVIETHSPQMRINEDSHPADWAAPASSRQMLEYLERSNLFILPLDDVREWYRYHRLFADLLRQRLQRTQPDILPELHRRAGHWLQQQQLLDEAIRHAFAAGDAGSAANWVALAAESTLRRGEITTFTQWVEQLPIAELSHRPSLLAYRLLTLLWSGAPLEMVEAGLAILERGEARSGMDAPIRAFIAINRGQIPQARRYCLQAQELIPESEQLLRGLADLMLALCFLVEGDERSGVQSLEKALLTNRTTGNLVIAVLVLYHLVEQSLKEGKLRPAQALCEQVLEMAGDSRGNILPIAGRAMIRAGEIAWERNDLDAAQGLVLKGIELTEAWSPVSAFNGYLALVGIRRSQGELDGAGQALERLRALAIQFDATEIDDLVVDLLEARLNIARGDLLAVHRWADRRGWCGDKPWLAARRDDNIVTLRLRKYEALVLARLWLAEGDVNLALLLLDWLRDLLGSIQRPKLMMETELLRALAFQILGQAEPARQAIQHALSLAEPEGYVRIFIDEGQAMAALLRAARPGLPPGDLPVFTDQVLLAFNPLPTAARLPRAVLPLALYEPLSERELEILRLLQSSLSVQDIAAELYLSVHTVRSHLKSIYVKLDVHSRYEAINRARQLDLI